MLLSATENLSNPCLSESWRNTYPTWGMLFAVITIVLLQVLDYILSVVLEPNPLDSTSSRAVDVFSPQLTNSIRVAPTAGGITTITTDVTTLGNSLDIEHGSPSNVSLSGEFEPSTDCNKHTACKDHECTGRSLLPGSAKTKAIDDMLPAASPKFDGGGGDGLISGGGAGINSNPMVNDNGDDTDIDCNRHPVCKDTECNGRTILPAPETSLKARAISGLIMSEVSICTHSIIIGLTLGVTSSSQFTALFVAIIFHQLLEGVALGSNASEAGLRTKHLLMLAGAYSLTTPIGIAIGIGVRYSLNTNSVPMLMTTGILDAISAGTLIFLALGDHMNALKSQGGWLRVQKISIQLACFASFFIGAAVLLTLALWA
jgi:zinc transporter ZupT